MINISNYYLIIFFSPNYSLYGKSKSIREVKSKNKAKHTINYVIFFKRIAILSPYSRYVYSIKCLYSTYEKVGLKVLPKKLVVYAIYSMKDGL